VAVAMTAVRLRTNFADQTPAASIGETGFHTAGIAGGVAGSAATSIGCFLVGGGSG